jgi:hypothetical protein
MDSYKKWWNKLKLIVLYIIQFYVYSSFHIGNFIRVDRAFELGACNVMWLFIAFIRPELHLVMQICRGREQKRTNDMAGSGHDLRVSLFQLAYEGRMTWHTVDCLYWDLLRITGVCFVV